MVIAVLACVAAMLAAPAGALAADGSIAGEVTDSVTSNGIEGVEVCAYQMDESGEDFGCSTTDIDGRYEITGLSPGEYIVEFWPAELNYQGQWFDGKSFEEEPDTVTVTSGGSATADAALEPGGEIEGTWPPKVPEVSRSKARKSSPSASNPNASAAKRLPTATATTRSSVSRPANTWSCSGRRA
ncbi:MAG TPA: carboxypeptidase regulatory-like domain-containing protein [Solirubrobacterales bacterium]|nr:carboxypeptidase regulatory-like domain-containing protein [Solirubrobacterales bacterium]